ncbi:hypothetical protein [Thorsellia kenyensis]|uniref:Thiamine kinase n=1 Tax=Thorsellia kenyensis TaxID=1549888 RepID=A0ABV6CAA0_9GAMM
MNKFSSIKQLIVEQLSSALPCSKLNLLNHQKHIPKFNEVSGLSSQNFQLTLGDKQYLIVPLITDQEKQKLGVNLKHQIRAIQRVSSDTFAPTLIYHNQYYAMFNWVDGKSLDQLLDFKCDDIFLLKIALIQSKIHSSPLSKRDILLKPLFESLLSSVMHSRRTYSLIKIHKKMLGSPYPKKSRWVFDHMDMHLGNIIQSKNDLVLIDWEYSANVEQNFAFCSLFNSLQLSQKQKLFYLTAYHHHAMHPDAFTEHSIKQKLADIDEWQLWYDYLCHLWYEIRFSQTQDSVYLKYINNSKICI